MSAAEALAPEQSTLEVRESLTVTEKGQPANTIGTVSYTHLTLPTKANV